MRGRKAQVAIEYIMLIGFILMTTVIMLFFIGQKIINVQKQNDEQTCENIKNIVMQHVQLAVAGGDGFKTSFSLPRHVEGLNYSLRIEDNQMLVVDFDFEETAFYLPSDSVGNFCFEPDRKRNTIVVRNVNNTIEVSSCINCSISYQKCNRSMPGCGTLTPQQRQQCREYCLC